MTKLSEMISVMQAFKDGEEIETCLRGAPNQLTWYKSTNPVWNWYLFDYRVKRKEIKRWINIYPRSLQGNDSVGLYITRDLADTASSNGRIACVEVSFHEGDGL